MPRNLTLPQPDRDGKELLTTGEAARLLGSSRQHVVDLCAAGDLPCRTVGTHRRIRRDDVEALRDGTSQLTRDQRRSLWLGMALAGRLASEPDHVLTKARRNLVKLKKVHAGQGAERWLEEWDDLLHGSPTEVLEALTSASPRARDLRQNSPFAGILSQGERQKVLAAFKASEGSKR